MFVLLSLSLFIIMFLLDWSKFLFMNFLDNTLIQLLTIYVVYLFIFSKNIFYTLFYFFTLIFYLGCSLCIYQLDLFVGFLWLIECVVIFVFMLLLFFLQTTSTWNTLFFNSSAYFFSAVIFIFLFSYLLGLSPHSVTNEISNFLNNNFYLDDFYESLNNTNINDFIGFLISYYLINSFLLILMGFLILVASVICVNLNKLNRFTRVQNITSFFNVFDFFKNSTQFIFMRQQNLMDQEASTSGTRIFKKKTNL